MSTTPALSSEEVSTQRFVDKQMVGVIEAIALHIYSLSNKGLIPSDRELAAYVDSLDATDLVQMIRKHPGAVATRAHTATDEDLLRWAHRVGRSTH